MPEMKTRGSDREANSDVKYVLVVGNDADNLVYTSILLQRFNYQICSAFTVDEALDLVDVTVPSLVITDLKTSVLGAPQLIERLKQKPETARIPVIAKTEHLSPELERKCLDAGAWCCLKKPVDPEDLYRTVQAAIEATPRERIRIETRLSVMVNNRPLDESAGEYATVLSSRGMYVETRNPFPVKTRFPVRLKIDEQEVNAEAKVIYSHKEGEGPSGRPGMGLFFVEISKEHEQLLKQYIVGQVTRGMKQPKP